MWPVREASLEVEWCCRGSGPQAGGPEGVNITQCWLSTWHSASPFMWRTLALPLLPVGLDRGGLDPAGDTVGSVFPAGPTTGHCSTVPMFFAVLGPGETFRQERERKRKGAGDRKGSS